MKKSQLGILLFLIIGFLALGIYLIQPWIAPVKEVIPVEFSKRNIPSNPQRQHADIPRVIEDEYFDPRFILMRGTERFLTPKVTSWSSPLGTVEGGFAYDAQGFGENNEKRGGLHSGHDLNGIGGENTDLGDPVYAIADGLVLYVGNPSLGWGNVVVLAHRMPDGRILQSLYAHLQSSTVAQGQIVGRNRPIGTVGNADGLYFAHLHHEIIDSTFLEAGLPAYSPSPMNRLNSSEILAASALSAGFFLPYDIFFSAEEWELSRQRTQLQLQIITDK